ncbi:MAG TPA: polysaccharide deacetylase family protein [Caldisericia bacterium]|nr:polysaccharide deacetylase family protein [Caldisericia bacterium]
MKVFPNTIINFHKIYDKEWMESVLLFLSNNYHIVSLQDIESYYYNQKPLHNCCHITFDDGDRSFYTIVYPLIQKFQLPISIYVSPKVIKTGENFWFQEIRNYNQEVLRTIINNNYPYLKPINSKVPLNAILKCLKLEQIFEIISEYRSIMKIVDKEIMNMSEEELKEVYNSGLVAIGAHTQNHPILANETEITAQNEIQSSIIELSEILGIPVRYFAYPNGIPQIDFGEREMNFLKGMNIKLAFSTENKSFSIKDNPLSIPRNGISKGNKWFLFMKLILGNKWDKVKRIFMGKQEDDYRKEIRNIIIQNKGQELTNV